MFAGTKVKSVNTMNLDGKNKRRGMVTGKTAKTKKAIVALTEDSKDIEILRDCKKQPGPLYLLRSRTIISHDAS